MISALSGQLKRVDEDRVHLQAGPVLYELLVPAADVTELQASLGEDLTLPSRRTPWEEDAIEALLALGEPRPLAERLLDRVKQTSPTLNSTDAFLREMLRLRTTRL